MILCIEHKRNESFEKWNEYDWKAFFWHINGVYVDHMVGWKYRCLDLGTYVCDQQEEIKIFYRNDKCNNICINLVVMMFQSCTWSTGI